MIRDYQRNMNFQRVLPYILYVAPLQRWKHILLLRSNKVSNKINERSTEVKLLLNNYVAIIRRSLFGSILQSSDINFSANVCITETRSNCCLPMPSFISYLLVFFISSRRLRSFIDLFSR